MAIIKGDNYNGFEVQTGDEEIDGTMGDQLKLTAKELVAAINAENVSDQLFARILKNRSAAHQTLLKKVPGATSDG